MGLPVMRDGVASREFLRIAGGYGALAAGASPAGGLDIDDAGNLATDGDVTVEGVLDIGGGYGGGGTSLRPEGVQTDLPVLAAGAIQSNTRLCANGAAGTLRTLRFTTLGAARWDALVSDAAETGSNAGSNFELRRYADSGTLLGTALRVTRSSGVIELLGHTDAANGLDVNGGYGGGGTSIDSSGVRSEGALVSKATAGSIALVALDDAARGGNLRFQCTRSGVGTWYFGVDATDNVFKFDLNHSNFSAPVMALKPDNGVEFYGLLDFKGSMTNSARDPTSDTPVDWVEIKINGATRYLPAYLA